MITIEPIKDRVIVRKQEPKEVTESGILLTGTSRETPAWALVVAVGPGTEDEPMVIKPGDKVIFPTDKGVNITLDDIDYIIFKQEDIYAVVQGIEGE